MEFDLSALRAIERDKEIPLDYLLKALEDALLNAYEKTEDAIPGARVVIDRKAGQVAVMVPELAWPQARALVEALALGAGLPAAGREATDADPGACPA